MKKITMSLLLLILLPISALAENTFFVCEEDSRPFDGDYQKISIVSNEFGKHDVYQTFIQGGMFPDGHKSQSLENELIAENLLCYRTFPNNIECYDEKNLSRLPVIKFQTAWFHKDEYIDVTHNFKQIAFFKKRSCSYGQSSNL